MDTFESIWAETSIRLRAFIRSRVEDDATADDLLQEVFVRIHQNITSLRSNERVKSWVYQITRHVVIDHYRSRRNHTPLSEAIADENEFFQEADAAEELSSSMRKMVDALPEPYREALRLTEFEGISQVELANRLGISLSGAKSRVQRARQKMKEELLACCHFEFDRYGRIIDYWENCCCCIKSQE